MYEKICDRQCNCQIYCVDFKEIFVNVIDGNDGLELIKWVTKILKKRHLDSRYDAAYILNMVFLKCIDQMAIGEPGIPPLAWDDSEILRAWTRKSALDTIELLFKNSKADVMVSYGIAHICDEDTAKSKIVIVQ